MQAKKLTGKKCNTIIDAEDRIIFDGCQVMCCSMNIRKKYYAYLLDSSGHFRFLLIWLLNFLISEMK